MGNDDAEDVTQETFLRVCRRLHTWRRQARFTTWLFQIARNLAIDTLRSRERRARADDRHPLPSPASTPELGVELDAALAALRPKAREALVLVEVSGLTYREAAAVLGVPAGTVKSRVFSARAALEEWFSEGDDDAL